MEIGKRLRYIRESKKMSIYKLSKITGMSHNHISDLERGARNPSIYTLCRLTEPLGITLSEFFNENDEAVFLSETERDLIHNFRKLPIVQSEKLFELIKVMADEN